MLKDNYKQVNIKKLLNPTIEYLQKTINCHVYFSYFQEINVKSMQI